MVEQLLFVILLGSALFVMTVLLYFVWFRPESVRNLVDKLIEIQKKYPPWPQHDPFRRMRHRWMQSPEWIWYARVTSTIIYLLTLAGLTALVKSIITDL